MKQLKYIFPALIFIAAVILTATFAAAQPVNYDIWVNGTRFTSDNAESGIPCGSGKAVYDAVKNEISLENATVEKTYSKNCDDGIICACIFAKDDITLELKGENVADSAFCMGTRVTNCAVYCEGVLTVCGNGSLSATGGLSTHISAGIYAKAVIFDGSVEASVSGGRFTSDTQSYAYGLYTYGGGMNITDDASITAAAYADDSAFIPERSYAIYSGGDIFIDNDASISAYAKNAGEYGARAIYSEGTLIMNGGKIVAMADGDNSVGMEIRTENGNPIAAYSGTVCSTGNSHAVLLSDGSVTFNDEYKLTASEKFNDTEKNCRTAETKTENGTINYTVKKTDATHDAKTVFFIRPFIEYDLWVNGIRVTNHNLRDILDDGRVSFDPEENLLDLNGATVNTGKYGGAYIYSETELTVNLKGGTKSLIGGSENTGTESEYGIYAAKGLAFTGGGILSVTADSAEKDSFGIYVRTGDFTVEDCTLDIRSGNARSTCAAIYTASKNTGDITLSDIATVTCFAGKAETMIGLRASGDITVKGASSLRCETAQELNKESSESYGIRASGDMTVSDSSSVNSSGGNAGKFSIGLYALGTKKGITVNGGKLTAVSGEAADSCYGIFAKSDITLTGGEIYAESKDASESQSSLSYGITCKELTLSAGVFNVRSGKGNSGSCGIYSDKTLISGSADITVASAECNYTHAMRKAPQYGSYAPVVYIGDNEPGKVTESPTEASYVNSRYVHIEKRFKSEKTWYAIPIYDVGGTFAAKWVGFTSDAVENTKILGKAVNKTGAAEYYNGYIYGSTAEFPFTFWRASFDGVTLGEPEIISESTRFSFGDMSYDYVTDTLYGLGTFNMSRAIFSVNTATGSTQLVVTISGTDDELLTLAFNREGVCYGIDLKGYLYTVSLKNGEAKKIGFTGYVPDGAQSMAFDRDTNELFWAYYNGITEKSGFCNVNTETGKAEYAGMPGGNLMELIGIFTIPKQYDIWIGGVRVNEENCSDIFGNDLVTFAPETNTLTFNGMKITTFTDLGGDYSFGIVIKDMDVTLVFNKENAIALSDVESKYSASICVLNGKATVTGGKLIILNTSAKQDNAIICTDGITFKNTETVILSNHNAITAMNTGADIKFTNSKISITAAHAGVLAAGGSIIAENSDIKVDADKDNSLRACALYASGKIELNNSTLYAEAGTNIAVYSDKIIAKDSTLEAIGAEQALKSVPSYSRSDGAAVTVSNAWAEESRKAWDKTTPLTSYNYVLIGQCKHAYDGKTDAECNICGYKRHITPSGEDFVPGDVDGNGSVDSSDARLALRRSVGLECYPEESVAFCACDVDFDGQVTSADARKILRVSVNLETI